jgi:hypothetical protein
MKQSGQGLPYPLAFLVLPIVLHPETRDTMPNTTNAIMLNWLGENAELVSDFPSRASKMSFITKETLLFALTYDKLALSEGRLIPGRYKYSNTATLSHTTDDSEACLRTAAFLGRWLVQTGSIANTLSSWGVRP